MLTPHDAACPKKDEWCDSKQRERNINDYKSIKWNKRRVDI